MKSVLNSFTLLVFATFLALNNGIGGEILNYPAILNITLFLGLLNVLLSVYSGKKKKDSNWE